MELEQAYPKEVLRVIIDHKLFKLIKLKQRSTV